MFNTCSKLTTVNVNAFEWCDFVIIEIISLTNRFHVAVRLFSNRSQMTSKCGKNKKVAHEAIAECVTDVLTTF